MPDLASFAFAAPWMLLAAAALPAIWWLLRVTPPSPRLLDFPPVRLLLALRPQEETPAKTPLWLLLMRLVLAALIVLALARPTLDPTSALHGNGPLILVIDDGWAAAGDWPARAAALERLIDRAERDDRGVHLLATAPSETGEPPAATGLLRAAEARRIVRAMAPKPWPTDRLAALAALDEARIEGSGHVAWLSDGLGGDGMAALAERLQRLGGVELLIAPPARRAHLLLAPQSGAGGLTAPVLRPDARGPAELWLRANAADGRLLARAPVAFADGEARAAAVLPLPGALRNEAARIEIEGEATAGATFLLDERWRRRPVGLVAGGPADAAQPLLSSLHFLERALTPFSEVHRGTLADLLKRELAVVVLADVGRLSDGETAGLEAWLERGGVMVRFAGPRLAQGGDDLIPVRLRGGERALGGAMSWSRPARLAPFDEASPFAGLAVPGDVRIRRQVLAQPSPDLAARTWARLTDGTPLVTAGKRGRGWLVLVHTTANTDWSNLPLSGLFVRMLRRMAELGQGVAGAGAAATLPPLTTLDAFGRLGPPPPAAAALPARAFADARAGPRSPPGFYGRETARRALNLSAGIGALAPIPALPAGVGRSGYAQPAVFDFKPWLLLAALTLALIDMAVAFALRGLLPARLPRAAGLAVLVFGAAALGATAAAQTPGGPDAKALLATLETRLAYVVTGDPTIDGVSRAGLIGLSRVLRRRTSIEPGDPLGVDVETDELAFYPLLYWAVAPRQPALSSQAVEKLNLYLRSGGTILYDTRDRAAAATAPRGATGRRLRGLLRGLDVPSLIPAPRDHVLTKAFYLLSAFPGRWTGGSVWVERRDGRHNDGVSSVVIGANDWAGAWAVDDTGAALFPVAPGGELQREMAYRFGVNWVMYALTGNYKTDQVHLPAIIERLGQ